MRERGDGGLLLDHSTLGYVVCELGRAPNCTMLSAMHRFERDMDRWLSRLDEKKRVH